MSTPMEAIREKCLDCCCGSAHEVKNCTAKKCSLYPYRLGKKPNSNYVLTPARQAALEKARLKRETLKNVNGSAKKVAP